MRTVFWAAVLVLCSSVQGHELPDSPHDLAAKRTKVEVSLQDVEDDGEILPYPGKRAYNTPHGAFHVFMTPAKRPNGSAVYTLNGQRYLSSLGYAGRSANYLYCWESLSNSGIEAWAFSRVPADLTGCYSVWYRMKGRWYLFGKGTVEHPN